MKTIYSKEFSKKAVFTALQALAEDAGREDLAGAMQYEIDKLAASAQRAAEKRGSVGSKDRMCSGYAVALAKELLGVMDATPQTAEQLVAKLAGKTINGKAITLSPWTYSVLGALAGTGKSGASLTDEGRAAINPQGVTVKETMGKATKVDAKGLTKEVLVKAYAKA